MDNHCVHAQHGHIPHPRCRYRYDGGGHNCLDHHIRHHDRLFCDGEFHLATLFALRVHALVCHSHRSRGQFGQELETVANAQQHHHAGRGRFCGRLYNLQDRHVQLVSDGVQAARRQEGKSQVASG